MNKEKKYNRDSIIKSVSKLFDTLSDPLRKKLVGVNIDNILSVYFDRINSGQLASALLSKFGSELFKPSTDVLQTIINQMNSEDIKKLAKHLDLNLNNNNLYDSVLELSNSSKDLPKFLDFFQLPNYFLIKKGIDTRKTQEEIDSAYGQKITSLGYPHDYQNFVKLELLEKLSLNSGKFSALIVMPTGSGKTRTAVEFMIDFIRNRKSSNILWLVESPELAEQSLLNFKNLWQIKGDRKLKVNRCFAKFIPVIDGSNSTNIIFGGFDKLNSQKELDTKLYNDIKNNTDLLIIDEAHFALANTYESLISAIVKNSSNIISIGLTATPMRPNDTEYYGLKQFFSNKIIEFKDENNSVITNPLEYLQEKGYLATIETEYLSLPEDQINAISLDLNDKVMSRIKISIDENKQIIVFAISKDHAIALDILLKTKDISSACIVGETASQERQHFFKEFTNKKINVLINYDILCTGIDLPKVDELFILRKFGQHTTAMQVLGRALRGERNGGNKTNKVISIKGNRDIINNANNLYNLIKNMY